MGRYIPILLLSSGVMPPNLSNRSAIRFMICRSAVVSPEGRKRYQRANCSWSAFSTSSNVGNPFTGAPAPLYHTSNIQTPAMHFAMSQEERSEGDLGGIDGRGGTRTCGPLLAKQMGQKSKCLFWCRLRAFGRFLVRTMIPSGLSRRKCYWCRHAQKRKGSLRKADASHLGRVSPNHILTNSLRQATSGLSQ